VGWEADIRAGFLHILSGCWPRRLVSVVRLDFDFRSNLNDLLRRYAKVDRATFRVSLDKGEHNLPPSRHARWLLRWDHSLATDDVRNILNVDPIELALRNREPEAFRNVRLFGKTVVQKHPA
jgi:hypothetical protein